MTLHVALPAVQKELERECAELSGPMLEICRYAVQGGRRVRAAVLLCAGQESGGEGIRAASAIELLHAATLLQDDIFDSGLLRRGRATAHVKFGRALTILASDWLLIRSLEMAAGVDPRFFRKLAQAGTAMARAEAEEMEPPVPETLVEAERSVWSIATGKTAALFEAALCGAALLRGVSGSDRERWEAIGVRLGLTYQMADDCLDVYGDEAAVQKSVGADLPGGRLTMPVLLAAEALRQQGVSLCLGAIQSGHLEQGEMSQLRRALRSAEVKSRLGDLLERRVAAHRREAESAGIPEAAVALCFVDLEGKLGMSFLGSRQVAGEARRSGSGLLPRAACEAC